MHARCRGALLVCAVLGALPARGTAQQPGRVRLGVYYATGLISARDTFVFRLADDRRVTLHAGAREPFFPGDFAPGESYQITQVSGTRPCTPQGGGSGTMPNGDIRIPMNCGSPPLSLATLVVTGVGQGEAFHFADNFRSGFGTPFDVRANIGGFPVGDSLFITQRSGPRTCRITPARSIVPATAFEIAADCRAGAIAAGTPPTGTPPAGGPPGSAGAPSGTLTAPPGTRIVLAFSATDSLVVTARTEGTARFTSTPFTFRRPNGANGLTVRRAPAGVRCAIAAAADAPDAPQPIRVACGREWEHASRGSAPTALGTYFDSFGGVIGGEGATDGRYVAFASDAAGIAGSSGRMRQVFWRDRWTNTTRLVSVAADGSEGDKASSEPSISADGQVVAFASVASNLPGADNNGYRDVFLWRATTGTVERVSVSASGVPADAESYEPSISGDGTVVAFSSSANTLVPGPRRTSSTDVYVKDMRTGEVTLLSREQRTAQGAGASRPSISDDGTRVVFSSAAALRDDDRNNLWDIYLWERGAPGLRRLSLTSTGGERNQGDESASRVVAPSISGNGRWVTFATTATNMGGTPTTMQQLYLVDVESGAVTRISVTAAAAVADGDTPLGQGERVPISRDGQWIAFNTGARNLGASTVLKNRVTGEAIVLTEAGASVGSPMVSREGLFILVAGSAQREAGVPASGAFVKLR